MLLIFTIRGWVLRNCWCAGNLCLGLFVVLLLIAQLESGNRQTLQQCHLRIETDRLLSRCNKKVLPVKMECLS